MFFVCAAFRLNPRAPSFNLPLSKQQQQSGPTQPPTNQPSQFQRNHQQQTPQQNNNNPSVSSNYSQLSSLHQQYKNLGGNPQQQQQQGPPQGPGGGQQGGGWAGYGNTDGDHLDFQGLAALAGEAIDPQTLLSEFDTFIGHENIPPAFAPFATLDCLDTPPHLPQPIIAPQIPNVHGGHNMCHGGQQQPWLGMYGSSNQQPQGYPSNNPPPPIQGPNRDGRNNYQGMGKFDIAYKIKLYK